MGFFDKLGKIDIGKKLQTGIVKGGERWADEISKDLASKRGRKEAEHQDALTRQRLLDFKAIESLDDGATKAQNSADKILELMDSKKDEMTPDRKTALMGMYYEFLAIADRLKQQSLKGQELLRNKDTAGFQQWLSSIPAELETAEKLRKAYTDSYELGEEDGTGTGGGSGAAVGGAMGAKRAGSATTDNGLFGGNPPVGYAGSDPNARLDPNYYDRWAPFEKKKPYSDDMGIFDRNAPPRVGYLGRLWD